MRLASLLLPVLARSKEAARATVCLSNLHQVGVALRLGEQFRQGQVEVGPLVEGEVLLDDRQRGGVAGEMGTEPAQEGRLDGGLIAVRGFAHRSHLSEQRGGVRRSWPLP